MRVCIVHYHLRPGGVTRVIEEHARHLREQGVDVRILSGEAAPRDFLDIEVLTNPALGYRRGLLPDAELDELAGWLLRHGRDGETVYHSHNPALGKNPALPFLVARMMADGAAVVAHHHDFAEDNRPWLYRALPEAVRGKLYPIHPRVRHLTTSPDFARPLVSAGVPEEWVTAIPNPVGAPPWAGANDLDNGVILYPTRAIRRKNLGEFLLWAALDHPGHRFAVTLAPAAGSAERAAYEQWKTAASQWRLPVDFLEGRPAPPVAVAATTSIQEGFGMAFAEPWLAGIPVAGRRLPAATRLLTEAGLRLERTYDSIDVSGLPLPECQYRRQRRPPTPLDTESCSGHAQGPAGTDFKNLEADAQRAVIQAICRDKSLRDQIRIATVGNDSQSATAWLSMALAPADPAEIEHDAAVVRRVSDPATVARTLLDVYAETLRAHDTDPIDFACPEAMFCSWNRESGDIPAT